MVIIHNFAIRGNYTNFVISLRLLFLLLYFLSIGTNLEIKFFEKKKKKYCFRTHDFRKCVNSLEVLIKFYHIIKSF